MPATLPDLPGSSADLSTRAVPNHPGRSSRCLPVASPLVAGFILVGRLATFVFLSRPNRVHWRYGSRVRLTSRTSPLLELPLARLHVEQAIYMVNSFQFTRSARLILASDRQGAAATGPPPPPRRAVTGPRRYRVAGEVWRRPREMCRNSPAASNPLALYWRCGFERPCRLEKSPKMNAL